MAVKKQAEQEYSIESLRKGCGKLFGVSQSTFDGAMEGREGPMTVEAAGALIEEWKGKAVM